MLQPQVNIQRKWVIERQKMLKQILSTHVGRHNFQCQKRYRDKMDRKSQIKGNPLFLFSAYALRYANLTDFGFQQSLRNEDSHFLLLVSLWLIKRNSFQLTKFNRTSKVLFISQSNKGPLTLNFLMSKVIFALDYH